MYNNVDDEQQIQSKVLDIWNSINVLYIFDTLLNADVYVYFDTRWMGDVYTGRNTSKTRTHAELFGENFRRKIAFVK